MSERRVQVIQSHREPLPAHWYGPCIDSVRHWARSRGFDYRWLGDELFAGLSPELMKKTADQPVVATDLARLQMLQAALEDGFDQAVWVDADVLILRPGDLELPAGDAWFGREIWVQADSDGQLRVYRKIHNAFMTFSRGDPVLPFYRFAAERILNRYRVGEVPMVAQLIGPKLLAVLHNAVAFEVLEGALMLPPAVARDLLDEGGAALDLYRRSSSHAALAINLCGSSVLGGELTDRELTRLVSLLQRSPELLDPH